jgi:alpha-1,6-mannosyltransferase
MSSSPVATRELPPVQRDGPPVDRGRALEAAVCASATAVVIAWRPELPVLLSAALVLGAAMLAIDLAHREHETPSSALPFVFAIAALLVVAVARAPNFPTDVRSYAADGRIIAHYHLSPYLVRPGRFPGDPLFARIPNSTAPYGPLFIAQAALVAKIVGTTVLWSRLAYQATAALAIAAALALLWRATRSTAAIVLVGLHPVVAGTIVNGGHNDALVGLALLAAVLVARRMRYVTAGAIVAGAALVKITAGIALVPMALWAATKGGRRAVFAIAGASILVVVPVVLAVPGLSASIRSANLGLVTRTSVWNVDPFRAPLLPGFGDGMVTQLGLVLVGLAVLRVASGRYDLGDRVAGCLAAWLVLSAYVMPWYTLWALPVAALRPRGAFTRVIAWQGAVVATAFLVPRAMLGNRMLSLGFGWLAPLALLVAFAAALRDGAPARVVPMPTS